MDLSVSDKCFDSHATVYNWANIKVRMWSLNLGKPTNIPQLNEAMAIELGSTLLGEIILFAVPATILVFEYIRFETNTTSSVA